MLRAKFAQTGKGRSCRCRLVCAAASVTQRYMLLAPLLLILPAAAMVTTAAAAHNVAETLPDVRVKCRLRSTGGAELVRIFTHRRWFGKSAACGMGSHDSCRLTRSSVCSNSSAL